MTVWTELPAPDVWEILSAQAASTDGVAMSGFLDTHQWSPLAEQAGVVVHGGHDAAQFRRVYLGTSGQSVRCFQVALDNLPPGIKRPRELRSWLYRAGLPDGSLGDIIVTNTALIVTEPDIELMEVGLAAELLAAWPGCEGEVKRTTSAGVRADAVAGSIFNVSRGEVKTAIKHGFLFNNFKPVIKASSGVQPGDQLVYRTKGRVAIKDLSTNPRSGRQWVEFQVFPC